MNLSVVIPLGEVPDGETVTKLTGSKPYIVSRSVKLYSEVQGVSNKVIEPDPSCVFMIGDSSINIASATKKVLWQTNLERLNIIDAEKHSK